MDSLKKEAETRRKINQKIEEKVNNNMGTWIDWQYLLNATLLLAKVCYSLLLQLYFCLSIYSTRGAYWRWLSQ